MADAKPQVEAVSVPHVSVAQRRDPEEVQMLDESTLDPQYQYRWVHERPQRIARMNAKGYRVVSSDEGVKTLSGQEDHAADTRIRNGDTILMRLPKREFLKGRQAVADVARNRLAAPKGQFRKAAREANVNITDKE